MTDAKQLLKYALDKLTPDQASDLLSKSDIVFGIAGTYARFEDGGLKDVATGNPISGGIGAVTGVKTAEEAERLLADRKQRAAGREDDEAATEAADAARLAASNPQLATQHTLLGGGQTRTLSPTKDGVNVLGGNPVGADHGRLENIATNGQATAGFVAGENTPVKTETGQVNVVTPDEAKRLAAKVQADAEKRKAEAAAAKK